MEEEKAQKKELQERFKPLIAWLKKQADEVVRDGKICVAVAGRRSLIFACSCNF